MVVLTFKLITSPCDTPRLSLTKRSCVHLEDMRDEILIFTSDTEETLLVLHLGPFDEVKVRGWLFCSSL